MGFQRLLLALRPSLHSLAVHRLRSTLTALGIVLGVGSVIVMLAVGEAARFEAVRQIQQLGATNIIVRSVKPSEENKRSSDEGVYNYGLTVADMHRMEQTIPSIVSVTPLREFRKNLRYLERQLEGRVVAVLPNYQDHCGLVLARGRFITRLDNVGYENVAILGAETAEILFPMEDPIGKSIRIDENHFYRVVGITQRKVPSAGTGSSLAAQDFNRDVYIPFETDRVRFGPILTYFKAGNFKLERLEVSQLTVAVDRMENVKKTAEVIQGTLDQFHTKKDTELTVPLDLLERAERTQRLFTMVLGAIASISLVVGGIGIMNIMLATVTERTREIGVRRALGAKRRDIAWQFILETTLLSSLGGLLGIGLGLGLSFLVTRFFALPTIVRAWSVGLAFSVSVGVGLIFGTFPARRAAHMEIIEALRHE